MKKQFIHVLTIAVIFTMTACSSEAPDPNFPSNTKTPITIGKLAVGGEGAEPITRAVEDWSGTYAPFNQGDELTVTTGSNTTASYHYRADSTWIPTAPLYVQELNAAETFTAEKGAQALVTDQNTLTAYRSADYITGPLILNTTGTQLVNSTEPGKEKLTHQHVDVVITITPATGSTHWDGLDFVAHMQATTVTFHTDATTGKDITPFRATTTPQAVEYRAVIPAANMPAADGTEKIISIGNLTATYTATGVAAGKRLAIAITYDNKRTLTAKATVTPWITSPDYTAEHNAYDMIIRTADDLRAFRDLVNEGRLTELTAIQVADIDLESKEWTPIGTPFSYTGIYNGGGHTITGLKIVSNDHFQALFSGTIGATLTGINLVAPSVEGGAYVGGLVGTATNYTHISNCSVQGGSVTGAFLTGALVGLTDCTIAACYATGTTGTTLLVGDNSGTIAFCYTTLSGIGGGTTISSYAGNGSLTDRTGDVTIRTGIGTSRTITGDIWGPGNQPTLNW